MCGKRFAGLVLYFCFSLFVLSPIFTQDVTESSPNSSSSLNSSGSSWSEFWTLYNQLLSEAKQSEEESTMLLEQLEQLRTEAKELYSSSKSLGQQLEDLKKLNNDLEQSNKALQRSLEVYKGIALAGVCLGFAGVIVALLK